MDSDKKPCPICKYTVRYIQIGDGEKVNCRRCGEFLITRTLCAVLEGQTIEGDLLPCLSCYTRQANQQGIVPDLNTENWRGFALSHSDTPLSQKIEKMLREFAKRSSHLGSRVNIYAFLDYPLFDSISADEIQGLLDYLTHQGWITWGRDGSEGYSELTVEGWKAVEPLLGASRTERCFIAMSFDPALHQAYEEGIYLAIRECRFDPVRIDRVHHNEKICDKIIAEIRQCQFMVADFTYQRAGVYFEAGFAMGLGRPVIWTCRKDDFLNTHFDTRQYNHIVWETPDDLREMLVDRIRATIRRVETT